MNTQHSTGRGRLSRAWHSKQAMWGAFIILGAGLAVVILVTVLGIVSPKNQSTEDAGASAPVVGGSAAPQTAAAAPDGGCPDVPGDSSLPPTTPADLRYQTGAEGLTWPVSASAGPTKTVDGFDACFARSRVGAALAAVTAVYSQYDTRHAIADALNFYIANSPGKQIAVTQTTKGSDPSKMISAGMTSAGFIVDAFSPDQAQITLVYTFPSSPTGYGGIPCTVAWVDHDWKLIVLDNGELSAGQATTHSKGDFVPWTGGKS